MPKHAREEDDLEVGEAPTSINPYEVLSVAEDAPQEEIKKAYRRAALRHHPDKVSADDKDVAHVKFQEVAFAYAVLSDERRRKRYDTTGSTAETLDLEDDDFDWLSFYREQYAGVVTEQAINEFAVGYKGSDEEAEAVLKAYTKHRGSMRKLFEDIMLSDMEQDEERFRAIIDKAIADKEVDSFDNYTRETESARQKRVERARKSTAKEAQEAAEAAEEIKKKAAKKRGKKAGGDDSMGDLAALIQQRQNGRENNFLANLEAKYAPKGKRRGADLEPPEEAFAKNRQTNKRPKK